jgi:LPXTG-site transpeptidase (sortase) family protein
MSLYSYKKAPIKNKVVSHEEVRELLESKKKGDGIVESSLWKSLNEGYNRFLKNYSGSRWIGLIIPSIFILLGIILLISQITPQILSYIETKLLNNTVDPVSVVSEDYYKDKLAYISTPQSGYFSEVVSASKLNGVSDTVSAGYKGTFYLDIPKINTVHARVQANVKSDVESAYKEVLGNNLAHFAGTPIPGQYGNVFIYGHSIDEAFYRDNPSNPVVEFTKLGKLNTGDKIFVEIDDKKIEYTVSQIKIVNPTDTAILDSKGGKTLTLMTCYPFGNNAKRLIVIARQES